MARVLCTGIDPLLLQTRRLILERAGHTVFSATDELEVRKACAGKTIDVAVIGQTVSHPQKHRILSLVREYCPGVRVLELYTRPHNRVLTDADDWLEVPADIPADLAMRVTELARNSSHKAR